MWQRVDAVPITMPHQDLTVTKATVLRLFVEVGEKVESGQSVVEVETEKAISEIEAPATGVLKRIAANPETIVALGELLGVIDPEA